MSVTFPLQHTARLAGPFVAMAGQTDFFANFPIQTDTDIRVPRTRGGAVQSLVAVDDYEVIGAGDAAGFTVRLAVPALAGDVISIWGDATLERVSSVAQQGRFSAIAVDREFDRNRIIDQELRRDINAVTPAEPRANAVQAYDANGTPYALPLNALAAGSWDARGPLAWRGAHDDAPAGFAFLATDQSPLMFYLREGPAGTWAGPFVFAWGDNASHGDLRLEGGLFRNNRYFSTRAALAAVTVPAPVMVVEVGGHTVEGVGRARFRRIATPGVVKPEHAPSLGAWWELAEKQATPDMFGGGLQTGVDGSDTASFQAALDFCADVTTTPGVAYHITTVTMAKTNGRLAVAPGSELRCDAVARKNVVMAGANGRFTGSVVCTAASDGSNIGAPTYAVVWVQAENCTVDGLVLDKAPKCGVLFKDVTTGTIRNSFIDGKYLHAAYNEASTTGHFGVMFDAGEPSANAAVGFLAEGNIIINCVQGIGDANFGGGQTRSHLIKGNRFANCWDHAAYIQIADHCTLDANQAFNCRRPFVVDGKYIIFTNNNCFADDTRSDCDQGISVRSSTGCVITNNVLRGYGAGIALQDVNGTGTVSDNLVQGNTIVRTATGTGTTVAAGISVGVQAETAARNVVRGNRISGTGFDPNSGVLNVTTSGPAYVADDSCVEDNVLDVVLTVTGAFIFNIAYQRALSLCRNRVLVSGNAAAAGVVTILGITACTGDIEDNTFAWRTGGTNINLRGYQNYGTTNMRVRGNRCDFSAPGFVSVNALGFALQVPAKDEVTRNYSNATDRLTGTCTIAAGAASVAVTNGNCLAAFSRVMLTPRNDPAADAVAASGVYVTPGAGSFTVALGSGTAAASADFDFEIV